MSVAVTIKIEDKGIDRQEQAFPVLPPDMVDRVREYSVEETVSAGKYLYKVGERDFAFFLILDGTIDALQKDSRGGHSLFMSYGSRQFSGELNLFSARASLLRIRAAVDTRVLRVEGPDFRSMVSAEADIGEIILRAYILRRAAMISNNDPGTVIVGSVRSAEAFRIQSFLTRNGYPHRVFDTEAFPDAAEAISAAEQYSREALPIVILDGKTTLRRPSNIELADALGITELIDPSRVFDVAVVGAGPAGLAAAVYASSEGLETVVVETVAPGGQAGTSSRIENYLGFPTGISGQMLSARAQVQAQKFGARLLVARSVVSLDCDKLPYRLSLDDGTSILALSIVVASGARYRRLELEELTRFEGQGVHYAATSLEARLCEGSDVVVVGGGNSAGQAATFLSRKARHVHMLVRGKGLADTMSDYLVRRIVSSGNITLHLEARVTGLIGENYLEAVRWNENGQETVRRASNLFLMIGAQPNTGWLNACVQLDQTGFVKTGGLLDDCENVSSYGTSIPGIYAVGDVRARSIKRVAASVGEGSVVVHAIHGWLSEIAAE